MGFGKKNYYFISQQRSLLENSGSKILLEEFRIIVTIAKSKDVPIIVPKILFKAIDWLATYDIRKESGVHFSNPYSLPSLKQSEFPSNGWDNLKQYLVSINMGENMFSSVKARKLMANEFAVIDFPENWRQEVFDFLGHSEEVNKLHYQAPNVGKMLKQIAPALQKINDKFIGEDFSWERPPVHEMNEEQEKSTSLHYPELNMAECSSSFGKRVHNESLDQNDQESQPPLSCKISKLSIASSSSRMAWTPKSKNKRPCEFFRAVENESSPNYSPASCSSVTDTDNETPIKVTRENQRMVWLSEEEKLITEEFDDFITGNGRYPIKCRVDSFFKKSSMLKVCKNEEKYRLLRVKLNNLKDCIAKSDFA